MANARTAMMLAEVQGHTAVAQAWLDGAAGVAAANDPGCKHEAMIDGHDCVGHEDGLPTRELSAHDAMQVPRIGCAHHHFPEQ